MGFKQADSDPALFILDQPGCWILVYVDDMLVVCKSGAFILSLIKKTAAAFELRDLGPAHKFVGFQIVRDRAARTVTIHQQQLIEELLKVTEFGTCRPNSVPLQPKVKFGPAEEGTVVQDMQQWYASTVGSLLYLVVCTRPDLAYAVGMLARHTSQPTMEHVKALKGVLRYLSGTKSLGLVYGASQDLSAYTDADFGAELRTAKSTTGFVFLIGGSAFIWLSKRQPAVASSTLHAEYMAAFAACQEAMWVRMLLRDLRKPTACITIGADNQPMLQLLKQPAITMGSKHIDVKYHYTREKAKSGEVKFVYVSTDMNLADGFTKPLGVLAFKSFRARIGMK
jgi:hypothetical protein